MFVCINKDILKIKKEAGISVDLLSYQIDSLFSMYNFGWNVLYIVVMMYTFNELVYNYYPRLWF